MRYNISKNNNNLIHFMYLLVSWKILKVAMRWPWCYPWNDIHHGCSEWVWSHICFTGFRKPIQGCIPIPLTDLKQLDFGSGVLQCCHYLGVRWGCSNPLPHISETWFHLNTILTWTHRYNLHRGPAYPSYDPEGVTPTNWFSNYVNAAKLLIF